VPWAKTAVPHVPPRHVRRPRLVAMLEAATPGQLVLVSAPAGYGKTLLLAEWAALRPERVAWVSLDDDDGTEHRFWSAVLAALVGCAAVPDGGALHRLAALGVPYADPDFLPHLLTALDELPVPVTLVLDDVHELVVSAPVRALATFVHERPLAVQLVLSGRTDPPIPIARMRVAGELCEVRARDLAFSLGEAGALLAAADVEMVTEQVQLLVGETAGWAAGLQLAALSLREAPNPGRVLADLVGNSTAISDYLVGEILVRLPRDVRELLRAVSVCDPLTAGLAAAVGAREDAGEVLAALEQETSLVLSSGEGRIWYRIHPLLRAHLRADLQRRHPELVDQLHGRAADWFADHGQPVAALVHARQARDVVRVAALVERYSVSLVAMGEHVAARDAVSFLVAQGAGDDPLLATVAALIAVETGAPTAAGQHLTSATEGWPGEPPSALAALQGLVRSRLAGVGGDPDRMARTVAELARVGGWSDPDLVALARLDIAIERSTVGRLEEARLLAEEVLADARRRDQGYLAARALAVLAAVAGAEGDYRAMDRWAERADAELSRGGWQVTAAAALAAITGAYAALLDARPLRCLDLLDTPGTADPSIDALDPVRLALRAAALVDLGHGDQAVPELRRAQVGMAARPLPANVVTSAALLVHGAAADAGCHEIAAETVRVAQNLVGPTGDVLLMRARSAVAQALKARSGANGPRPDQAAVHRAAAALRPVLDGSARIIVPWAVTEGHVLACDLALATDRPVLARRELTRALVAAAHSGALRPLLAGGPAIVGLLALQLGSFGVGDAVAARVLEFRGAPHPDDVALTDREREVLGLLATPLSLPDIAVELDIAPSTVKTHVRAIYTKLGVTSRREAVVAGRRRGSLASGRS
jgi:LuxR family transcriptional regulator, maltose regulon positive regulatory protein